MQIVADGILLRSLPNPLTARQMARLRDARTAGPPPQPAPEPIRVQRRVSSRGSIAAAHQRITVGINHAGVTLDVEAADSTFRVYDGDQLITEVPRTTTKPIARFKVANPSRLATLNDRRACGRAIAKCCTSLMPRTLEGKGTPRAVA
jgi:hypothetical protein